MDGEEVKNIPSIIKIITQIIKSYFGVDQNFLRNWRLKLKIFYKDPKNKVF
jgi:hypothetical protein